MISNLFIPRKGFSEPTSPPDLNTDWLAIETWAAQVTASLNAPSSSGGPVTFSQTYSVSGTLQVPSGATGFLPPFYMPVTGESVELIGVRRACRSGSATVNLTQNGSNIATGMTVGTSPATTTFSVPVANNDAFAVVVASTASADGLSLSFYFTATP